MAIDVKLIKQLRDETEASIADCRMALEESNGDLGKAKEWLKKRGLEKAGKKADRETEQGLVVSYIHAGGKVGALIEILCETDFVAKTEDFQNLAKEVAMQVAAMKPSSVEELMSQAYIRDASQTMEQLVKAVIGKLGENITIGRFSVFAIGKE